MSDNIHIMPGIDTPPEVILSKAREWGLEDVLIIGWDKDGNFIAGGSMVSLRDISWLLRNADNWVGDRIRDVE